jgi:hypothetical protein
MENKMRDLGTILTKFEKIISKNFCNELAKKCRFIQRSTSQLQGYEFAQAMMIPNGFLEAETLHSLAVRMNKINKSCDLSASALAQRINTKGAQEFMNACFGKFLKEIVKQDFTDETDLHNLSGFNRILIEDSTRIELHEKLSEHFKGSGGVASKASVKIDYIFNYLTEEVIDIDFYPGNKPDQSLAKRIIKILEKDDLVIRDLGYFVINSLKEINENGAFFLSRWKVDQAVYESKEATKPLNLAAYLDKHVCEGIVDMIVFIGPDRDPVRLIACLMDEEAVNKRRRNANRSAKRRGTKVSKKKTSLMKYSIFITNVLSTMLSSKAIMAVYRARWRIELIFKEWKSCLRLDIFKGYKQERFYCFMYGRLIMVLLLGIIYPILMRFAFQIGRELSSYKLTNYLIADNALLRALQEGKLEKFMNQLQKDIPRRLCMDKRNRPTLRSNVKSNTSYYNELKMSYLDANVA